MAMTSSQSTSSPMTVLKALFQTCPLRSGKASMCEKAAIFNRTRLDGLSSGENMPMTYAPPVLAHSAATASYKQQVAQNKHAH
ncbi:hypothetical protein EVAR_18938_1 [Eumeta japonica]|uniref:Uncharacterized protein n=1 Tax=Eumeta variegata TaxID=151549 RepID=A0A4C1V3I6_EUMVA|nr:hypothetical protein EVAR_18938_1 [Eumeta japonica]